MRYIVSLQTETDITCYNDLEEFDVFEQAKLKAQELFEKFNRSVIIFDNKLGFVAEKLEAKIIKAKEETKIINILPKKIKRK